MKLKCSYNCVTITWMRFCCTCFYLFLCLQESLADAKVSARKQCIYEGSHAAKKYGFWANQQISKSAIYEFY